MNRVPVTLRRIVERRLPVRVDHGLHDRLLQCQAEPATVLVRGPQDVLDRASAMPTRPFIPPADEPGSALREVVVRGTGPRGRRDRRPAGPGDARRRSPSG